MHAEDVNFPFSVSATDVEEFIITPDAGKDEVLWHLEMDWLCAGRQGTTVIDDHGQPFALYPRSGPRFRCDRDHVRDCPARWLAAQSTRGSVIRGCDKHSPHGKIKPDNGGATLDFTFPRWVPPQRAQGGALQPGPDRQLYGGANLCGRSGVPGGHQPPPRLGNLRESLKAAAGRRDARWPWRDDARPRVLPQDYFCPQSPSCLTGRLGAGGFGAHERSGKPGGVALLLSVAVVGKGGCGFRERHVTSRDRASPRARMTPYDPVLVKGQLPCLTTGSRM